MLLLYRRGGGTASVAPLTTPAGRGGRAIERNGRIEYFESDEELEKFLDAQAEIPVPKTVQTTQQTVSQGVNAFRAIETKQAPQETRAANPSFPVLSRRQRQRMNDDEAAISALLTHQWTDLN